MTAITPKDLKRRRPKDYDPTALNSGSPWEVYLDETLVAMVDQHAHGWSWWLVDGNAKSPGRYGDPDRLNDALWRIADALNHKNARAQGVEHTMTHGNTKPQQRPADARCKTCGREDGDLIAGAPGEFFCDGSCQLQATKAAAREQASQQAPATENK
jgi:hypothetical protein